MKYKNTNNSYKWLEKAIDKRIIKKIKESSYGNGKYRQPAKYQLILNK